MPAGQAQTQLRQPEVSEANLKKRQLEARNEDANSNRRTQGCEEHVEQRAAVRERGHEERAQGATGGFATRNGSTTNCGATPGTTNDEKQRGKRAAERARAADVRYEEDMKRRRIGAERSERVVTSVACASETSAVCVSVERECVSDANGRERESARETSMHMKDADVFGGILQGASGPWWFE